MNGTVFSMWKGNVEPPKRPLLVPDILKQTAHDHSVSVKDMLSSARYREIAHARFDAMTRIRAIKGPDGKPRFSLPHIGRMLGGLDHTSVLHGLRRWKIISVERAARAAKREVEAA